MTKSSLSRQAWPSPDGLSANTFTPAAVIGDIFPKRMNPRAYASFRQKGEP